MKKVVLFTLFFVLILLSVLFYKKYFQQVKEVEIKEKNYSNENESVDQKENNIVTNLKYEIFTNEQNEYVITSKYSEVTYDETGEVILMNDVNAILKNQIDEEKHTYTISSDRGKYNNELYYTNFFENVKINFTDNTIFADELILDLRKNLILINNNVKYSGSIGTLKADNVKIDLITMRIDIFMNDKNKNISFISNR